MLDSYQIMFEQGGIDPHK